MNKIEQLKQELAVFQNEMIVINKRKKQVSDKIYDICKQIEKIESLIIKPTKEQNPLILRDITLCKSFLKSGPKNSREIIDFLNDKLIGQNTRWKKQIDGNLFMNVMGKFLKDFTHIDNAIINGRKMTIWTLK